MCIRDSLTVDLDASLVESTHELGVAHTFKTCSGIDTLNPECAEIALLVAAIAEGIGKTLLPSVLGNGPNVLAGTIVTAGKLEDSLALGARGYMIY